MIKKIILMALTAALLVSCSQPKDDAGQAVKPAEIAVAAASEPAVAESAPAPESAIAEPAPEPVAEPAPAQEIADSHRIDSFDPLSDEQNEKLSNITWDVDPEILNAVEKAYEGGHFPFTDELHLDLFEEHIRDLGGTYIGVGTDQGYLFVGWQKPTLALMIDYDPWVVIIHKFYMAFWKMCDDAACLHSYFDDEKKGLEWIKGEQGSAEGLNKALPIEVYKKTHRPIARQLKRVERSKMKSFMNDPETFAFIKNMIQAGRIRTLQANLLGDRAFASIASTLDELGAKVTTLYLSNAEQYWGYSAQFKKNIIGLPAHDNALILRTSATKPANNDYRYSIQPIHVFKAWLQHPDGKSVRAVTKRVPVKDPESFPFVIDDFMPPEIKPGGNK
ncbi:MAG: hypothetical protein IJU23_13140 [Proteobacteria bacterium]|nr:hypothetical protein [Pseudomonadota bacterium]